ncbi:MAG: hypothetical protein ACE5OP_08495 [Candidatus Glassbacteria bacterium]
MSCELCSLKGRTVIQHEDSICLITTCNNCKGAPLGVLKRHTDKPSREERDHLFRSLRAVASKKYGRDEFFIDETAHEYEEHYHIHARRL